MLVHLGERSAAGRIEAALEKVYRGGKHLTRDVGGSASTAEFTGAVVAAIELRHVQSDGAFSTGV
jgi:isocitrate/isopropylmalate dehydrogenase